jgi:hypothetical protein
MRWMYVKVKLSLSLINNVSCHEDVWGSRDIAPQIFTLALDGSEWSASCHRCFTPAERVPGTHWIGGWMALRAGLDVVD